MPSSVFCSEEFSVHFWIRIVFKKKTPVKKMRLETLKSKKRHVSFFFLEKKE
uniref:Uncharacterized protein n=1 Tax=Chlorella vulgaris TaxID=3077 RepID=V9H160_CHLVU|nr:hypothetical protein ChvulCp160 [Chlorella vulgaris]pir/T07346/ hypothetical protein 51e - Chlorella vulgaris chloroplast [Chlorella vulgaris]BAA57994.1 unnamed protein product [Chlorella vulgaris]